MLRPKGSAYDFIEPRLRLVWGFEDFVFSVKALGSRVLVRVA